MNIKNSFKKLTLIIVSSIFLLNACGEEKNSSSVNVAEVAAKNYQWKMVTSWPKNFPGLGMGPERFSQYVDEMSNGRLTIKVYGAGELVPGFEVFDAVSQGTVQMGHSGAYYWKGKIPASPIFGAIPFGMTATEFNAWLHYGGGLALWQELYQPFGIVPMAGGNSGAQFAGWFKKEINSMEDLKGLKMRIPGLGGEVLKRAGGVPVTLTGGEIFSSLQSGAIDASEWVGPYNDLAFGFHQAAEYYYSSVWHETGTNLEFLVNAKALAELPSDLQKIVEVAARAVNQDMLDEYNARNNIALKTLVEEHQVKLREFPPEIMKALKGFTEEVLAEQVANDAGFAKVWQSYSAFLASMREYNDLTLKAYYQNR
ncbi:TRAP transporter substrate-binding protein [Colwellia hornerae]|uniref:TRAP transporter substrate-binding protein n=1 Tax=Colwellia hornerae TaxID=89402 RepID=A0A5C6QE64_9GAMM|nr:TRAP transporter substrate-binding protein [Colwellia hornerae]TWX51682.1 TRAP transporter substrate-binding protein [Colwellia hornerae]TWX57470.1 TRAP transporter substrate-binding protein [Colwellia hornerae]TWX66973.1 TRAP transporter substrate-binding protein [Colwellia hornerae]